MIKVRETGNFIHMKESKEGKDINKILSNDLDYQIQLASKRIKEIVGEYKTLSSGIKQNAKEFVFMKEKHERLVQVCENLGINNEEEELKEEKRKKVRLLQKRIEVTKGFKVVQEKKYLGILNEFENDKMEKETKIRKLISILERIEELENRDDGIET